MTETTPLTTETVVDVPPFYVLNLYTDGGCRPSRGSGAWAVHGYLASSKTVKTGHGAPAVPGLEGYQDKSPPPYPTVIEYYDAFGNEREETTNNIMEMKAAFTAMELANSLMHRHRDILLASRDKIILHLDSKYVIDGITQWLPRWENNGWCKADGTAVENQGLWKQLSSEYRLLKLQGLDLSIRHVKGHSGNVGNDVVDRKASKLVEAAKRNKFLDKHVEYGDPKLYWKSDVVPNRMVDKSRWYFNPDSTVEVLASEKEPVTLYLGNHGPDDELFGTKTADASFSVVKVHDVPLVFEKAFKLRSGMKGNGTDIVVSRIDLLMKSEVSEDLSKYGDLFFTTTPRNDLLWYNATEKKDLAVIKTITPPLLALNAVEGLQRLEQVLVDFDSGREDTPLSVTEITSEIYELVAKAKSEKLKLKDVHSVTAKSFHVELNYDVGIKQGVAKTLLLYGRDLPARNTLSALADRNPKVFAVTWRESDSAFRYATIVYADSSYEGCTDKGVWSATCANVRILSKKELSS